MSLGESKSVQISPILSKWVRISSKSQLRWDSCDVLHVCHGSVQQQKITNKHICRLRALIWVEAKKLSAKCLQCPDRGGKHFPAMGNGPPILASVNPGQLVSKRFFHWNRNIYLTMTVLQRYKDMQLEGSVVSDSLLLIVNVKMSWKVLCYV